MAYVYMFSVISVLILIHELGHLLGAKLARIPVALFSVGFGPKLWGFDRGGTEYRASAIPFGGYVLPGVTDAAEFAAMPASRRLLFAFSGPLGNILAALFLASMANIAAHGFSLHGAITAPLTAIGNMTAQMIGVIPLILEHPDRLSGVVGIVAMGGRHAGTDVMRIVELAILLNVNLAVFNLLPLPPLDGGKIVMCLLQKIYKPLGALEPALAVAGWALLLCLMAYATVLDVSRLAA